ncbi:hypothetical protein LX32DRAFT_380825 [Colletotrichum zoysiae]|uniref:Uncharacterized protein n=1 Tax=Colletotrichum zoysiae TaxID=1216348 RepID=A0AAD9HIW6_9PEZI|nr:hypothetical protein LX32DRAFT_380825 [Colletotrichum zoysiae]
MEGRTLGATLSIHHQLRAFSLLALFLELIWTVSPRGGHYIMRVLETPRRDSYPTGECGLLRLPLSVPLGILVGCLADKFPLRSQSHVHFQRQVQYFCITRPGCREEQAARWTYGKTSKTPALLFYGDHGISDWQHVPANTFSVSCGAIMTCTSSET